MEERNKLVESQKAEIKQALEPWMQGMVDTLIEADIPFADLATGGSPTALPAGSLVTPDPGTGGGGDPVEVIGSGDAITVANAAADAGTQRASAVIVYHEKEFEEKK